MTLNDIYQAYNNNEYAPRLRYPTGPKLKEDKVIDENETVRWNRERVIELNNELQEARKAYHNEDRKLTSKLRMDCIQAIEDEYGLPTKVATLVYDHAYREKHAYVSDMLGYAGDLAELACEIGDAFRESGV